MEKRYLKAQTDRLEGCDTVWCRQHIVRIFWRDRWGRERLRRQIGIHRCRHAWCPKCGRSRQAKLSSETEKTLLLARDFGFHEGHGRLVTLTVPNGSNLLLLRDQAHHAFAKLQRTRWWNRHVFGWIRGSEVVTGKDGNWNLHLHLLVIFWSPKVSYQQIGRVWTQELGGPRENGLNYVVDCESLELKRWVRRDGKEGTRKHRGGLASAARYITKYLSKPEDFHKLKAGPGGLAHLIGATRGLRRFSMGGGCSILRNAAHVLLPVRAFQAEEAMAETYLYEGRPPCRVEIVDPETGEVREVAAERLRDDRQKALDRWGTHLETNPEPNPRQSLPGRVVGVPCGHGGKFRRLGAMPLAGSGPTIREFERKGHQCIQGMRGLIGPWKIVRWQEPSRSPGKILYFSAVLPAARYSLRKLRASIRTELAYGSHGWACLRRSANVAGSSFLKDPTDLEGLPRGLKTGTLITFVHLSGPRVHYPHVWDYPSTRYLHVLRAFSIRSHNVLCMFFARSLHVLCTFCLGQSACQCDDPMRKPHLWQIAGNKVVGGLRNLEWAKANPNSNS
ncbi:MAG: protein rep [Holophaga sp.]|nr:protein rep [Holophaga sp.]